MQVTVYVVFISFVIRAIYQTLYALSNGLNTFNPAFSACDEKNQSIYVVINAVLTCAEVLRFLLCSIIDMSMRSGTGLRLGFLSSS